MIDSLIEKFTHKYTTSESVADYENDLNTGTSVRLTKVKYYLTWDSARARFITRVVNQSYSPFVVAEVAGNSPIVIRNKYIPVTEVIEELAMKLENQERYKIGRVLKSLFKSQKYRYLNTSLKQFTQSKSHRYFTKYWFRDLNEK